MLVSFSDVAAQVHGTMGDGALPLLRGLLQRVVSVLEDARPQELPVAHTRTCVPSGTKASSQDASLPSTLRVHTVAWCGSNGKGMLKTLNPVTML